VCAIQCRQRTDTAAPTVSAATMAPPLADRLRGSPRTIIPPPRAEKYNIPHAASGRPTRTACGLFSTVAQSLPPEQIRSPGPRARAMCAASSTALHPHPAATSKAHDTRREPPLEW